MAVAVGIICAGLPGAKPGPVLCRRGARDYTRARLDQSFAKSKSREDQMKHLLTTALVAAAFALSQAAAAQDRYPPLKLDQLSPEQKAYVESLAKPPRNNTTA